ncbi:MULTISPECIES: hypothetical protein [unclassified Sphingomonas]|uniref:hypothetical protein n=1 Tax=unclassified Sphingomonas TaxID=196159 RepID=UPI000E7128CA|nr:MULTISPECIES: hypothetical protein [unclassified Sphingomonas]RKE50006.1 hypothetical protein C8J39_1565 [Sphingomonas sp. PP-CC-1A-547]TCM08337.1 hypothetical protein C8J41_102302 [Sphingomonas sp. PP-CC-3G-468]
MISKTLALAVAGATLLAACSGEQPATTTSNDAMVDNGVSLRNLAETDVAVPKPEQLTVKGRLIPTPSDPTSRHFLLRERKAASGTIIAILRQEHDGNVAYARTETDCGKRLFHVLGVGPNRALVETNVAHDGPLRPIKGLPLREELATYVCNASGTPLAKA